MAYGEQLYQRFAGLTDESRVEHLADNTQKLLEYFQQKPDLYDVASVKPAGWFGGAAEYSVSFAELVIE